MKPGDADSIEALLPQTQCELCEYPGCRPYAEAIAFNGEAIDRCLPGGVETLKALGKITHQDPTSMIKDMAEKHKKPSIARIREEACIGCTKCIPACPVDAIIGGAKSMHVIITDHCTGCELCLAPCPTDCIDMVNITEPLPQAKQQRADLAKKRYDNRNKRLHQANKKTATIKQNDKKDIHEKNPKLTLIQAAIAREKARKNKE